MCASKTIYRCIRWSGDWSNLHLSYCKHTSKEQPLGWGWEPPCTVSSAHWCASWIRCASPTTAQGTLLTSPLAEVCFQPSQWGASEFGIRVQWNAQLCTCGPQTWNHSLSPIPVWHLLPAVNVSLWCSGSAQTDCQVINKECSEDVPSNTRGQLINLPSITCHSQGTTNWNTFLWVNSESVVPILTRTRWSLRCADTKIGQVLSRTSFL